MNEKNRSLPVGTVIHNRYRIERVLGEGGFGVTYMVRDMKENEVSAMKEYFPFDIARRHGAVSVMPEAGYEEQFLRFRDRFLDEARVIYQFRGHPNIVRVKHLFYENNTAYYIMEYINGTDLEKLLSKNGGRLPWETLRPVISQVVTALSEVHKNGIIHCDISPDNIFILDGGQVKLIDFGAVKSIHRAKSSIVFLKRGYAPPEQLYADGGKLTAATDIYSLAVTVYRSVTGTLPPSASDRLIRDTTVWPSEMRIPLPSRSWEPALRRAMALKPQERYSDVTEFWQELTSTPAPERYSATRPALTLECVGGVLNRRRFAVSGELIFGTDRERCNILFPPQSPGISRVHLRVWAEDGIIHVMDMGSTYGTYIDGVKLRPGLGYPLTGSSLLYLGQGQMFCAYNPESR